MNKSPIIEKRKGIKTKRHKPTLFFVSLGLASLGTSILVEEESLETQLEGKVEEEAQRKSATRANPKRPMHITTNLAEPSFADGLTISYGNHRSSLRFQRVKSHFRQSLN